MPNLVEQISKAVQEQWPRALVGLLIPASQLVWKGWQNRQTSARAAALRLQITQLAQFLQTPLGDTPPAIAIRQSTQDQYDKALSELAGLCRVPEIKAVDGPHIANRSLVRSIFLLYVPRSFKGWVAHFLYYVFLSVTVLGAIGEFISGGAVRDAASVIIVFFLYAVLTFFLWRWAIRISDPARTFSRKNNPRWAWLSLLLIWISALMEACSAIGLSLDDEDGLSFASFRANIGPFILTTAACAIVMILSIRWRRRMKLNRAPGPRWGWIPLALIIVSAFAEWAAVVVAFTDDHDEFRMAAFRVNVGPFLGTTVVCAAIIILSARWRRHMKKTINSKVKPEPPPLTGFDDEAHSSKASGAS